MMKDREIEAMGLLIELVKWFRGKGTHPTTASIALGKFVAMSHAMQEEGLARELQAAFIESLNREFEQILAIKRALLDEHTNKSREVQ